MAYLFVPGGGRRREQESKSEEEINKETQEYLKRKEDHERLEERLKETDPKAKELYESYMALRDQRWKLEKEINDLPPEKKIPILSTLKEAIQGYRDLFPGMKEKKPSGIQGEYQDVCQKETGAMLDWDNYVSLFSFEENETPSPTPQIEEQPREKEEDKEKRLEELREDILGGESSPGDIE